MSSLNAREELDRCIRLYVLKQHRQEVKEAIAAYLAERDKALTYFIPVDKGPFKAEWKEISA